jgi:TetR/AcrR family transcriptional regulator, transcriptional repressor for nem operon
MNEAGLTNGAFYPHFASKAELVRESVATALEEQAKQLQEILASGGVELAISSYLSVVHRDNPAKGCTCATLALPSVRNFESDPLAEYYAIGSGAENTA